MRRRWYVGINRDEREAFMSATRPIAGTCYEVIHGPFRTARGARYMAEQGTHNPECGTVAAAERLAAQAAAQSMLAREYRAKLRRKR